MQFLYADGTAKADPNENSLVVRFTLGNRQILLMGDAPGGSRALPSAPPKAGSIEAKLLQCCTQDLASDVLIVAHHGSKTSSRNAFITAVGASIYAVSAGPKPYSGTVLPDHEIVAALKAKGQLFETDVDDAACATSPNKVGPDNDGSPGGCTSIRISISPSSAITAQYISDGD
jgi:competence protein ComEC